MAQVWDAPDYDETDGEATQREQEQLDAMSQIGGGRDEALSGAYAGEDNGDKLGGEGNATKPRDDISSGNLSGGSQITSTPKQPMYPSPSTGSVSTNRGEESMDTFTSRPSGAPSGVIVSPPMAGGPIGQPGGGRGLFGFGGGLKGGGLGVPSIGYNPNQGGDQDVTSLIAALMNKQKKGLF